MAKPIDGTDAATLQREIVEKVAKGSMVFTDEHAGYTQLWHSYRHATVKHSVKEFVKGMAHTNGIESVWAVLKRGYTGVYHQWSAKHTARYIKENTDDEVDALRLLELTTCLVLRVAPPPHQRH